MKQNRIGIKLGLTILAVLVVVLLSLGLAVERMFSRFYSAEMKLQVEEMAAHFAAMAESGSGTSDEMLRTFAEFSDVSIFYLKKDGNMIHLGEHDPTDRTFIHNRDVENIFAGEEISFEHTDPDGNRYLVVGRPLNGKEGIQSALYVMASTKHRDSSVAAVQNLLILSGIGAFLLALGMTWIISQMMSRPLIQMQRATKRIAAGELDTRVSVGSKDEIGSLAAAINDLAQDLKRYRDNRQQFFADISHELRTPITYLEGYANVLRERLYDTEEERDRYLGIIAQEAKRIQALVDDLFELAKMDEGQIHLSPEWIDLGELVQQAAEKAEWKAREKGLQLNVHIPSSPPVVYADGLRMEQVMLNLLDNAVRYTELGSIELRVEQTDKHAIVTVTDTGIGIPEEERPYVFDRFYRVEKSRSRQFGGTGLGLPIVKKLIELHGGTVTVSGNTGSGTCFRLDIPLTGAWEEGLENEKK
ncbi:sensor histidine kinase [Gorillibacterium massiliense]|uniref:sensor histidine kinase n=1 Tax=Gorillibacterium massiliense TaxID=1280390 RepID=UPI0004BC0725|nr:HAMP domain-containing sensor histidine kinase [Gorillibacterium massiliense]